MVAYLACGEQVAIHRGLGVYGSGAGAQHHGDEDSRAGDDLVDGHVLVGRVGAGGVARSVLHRGDPAESAQESQVRSIRASVDKWVCAGQLAVDVSKFGDDWMGEVGAAGRRGGPRR